MQAAPLEELIGRLRRAGLDVTAEDVADAVWLARRLGTAPPPGAVGRPGPTTDPEPGSGPGAGSHTEPAGTSESRSGTRPTSPDRSDPSAAEGADGADGAARPGRPDPIAPGTRASTPVPLRTAGAATGRADGGGTHATFPVRAPAASALPGLLGLEKALRTLGRYRVASTDYTDGGIDEEATAERAAVTGFVLPVARPGRSRRSDIRLLVDTGPAMAVWGQLVEELRQACQQSGAFAAVRVHHLHADAAGRAAIGPAAEPGHPPRLRSPDELHDSSGRSVTLLISDCVGTLWQSGGAQRLLRQWPRSSPLAIVQPLPPRLWGRTALPAEPGLLVRAAEFGGRLTFHPDDEPWDEPAAPATAVPVLQPTPEAFETWARLLAGTGPTSERAWAARTAHHPAPAAPAGTVARGDEELVRAFRATASPGALRLAVYLAAAPLTLPVMQLVQRAMLPDTGPMELAEVLLGGLLRRLPGTGDQPCFTYPGRVQDLLLSTLDQDTAGLVLKHCSDYVERRFGKGTRNFAALAAVRLAGRDAGPADAGPRTDDDFGPNAGDSAEAELFARVPARVLRFYLPDLVTPEPLTEAERLLGQWRTLADPDVLHRAREHAEAAVRAATRAAADAAAAPDAATAPDEADGVRARLVLGRVLRAEADTVAGRAPERRADLLTAATEELAAAHRAAPDHSPAQAESALELAAGLHALWRVTGDPDRLMAALDVLAPDTAPWPAAVRRATEPAEAGSAADRHRTETWLAVHRARLLRRGRLLLDLGHHGEAAADLRPACALLDESDAPGPVRSRALLDLARALRGAPADEEATREALLRAERAAGDDPALRLPCLAARAAFHDTVGEAREADEAYESAVLLAPPESVVRCGLLTTWGESLLRRASRGDGAGLVDRAESVLREALKDLPARSAQRGRLQALVGSALAQRFRHLGFLPDLFESRHLLGQAVRAAADVGVRAEAWLQLGRVRLEGWYRAGAPVLFEALHAYENAEREAQEAYPDGPGSVTVARARHGRGAVLVLLGRPSAAGAAYRAAREQWQRLTGSLREVDWDDVELTRRAGDDLAAERTPAAASRAMPEEEWRRLSPPWHPWEERSNEAEFARS
ncbi:SAV_2336 N-terminal domain-related protein [Streptomyces sp. NPDC060275]|uniref:SAV_2336 N-terminal domain-related protein n=1 Tax=Streptomyces sp. NPDC060275 TaxID=3347090 RepID=UPI0036507951